MQAETMQTTHSSKATTAARAAAGNGGKSMQLMFTSAMWSAVQAAELTDRDTGRLMGLALAHQFDDRPLPDMPAGTLKAMVHLLTETASLSSSPGAEAAGGKEEPDGAGGPPCMLITRRIWEALADAALTEREMGRLLCAAFASIFGGTPLPEGLGATVAPLAVLLCEAARLRAEATGSEPHEEGASAGLRFTLPMWEAFRSAELTERDAGRVLAAVLGGFFTGTEPAPELGRTVFPLALLLLETARRADARLEESPEPADALVVEPLIWRALQSAGLSERDFGRLMDAVLGGFFSGRAPAQSLGAVVLPLALLVLGLHRSGGPCQAESGQPPEAMSAA